ncbi:MAG: NACHT domain-containing protein [Agriterribacter sp.]
MSRRHQVNVNIKGDVENLVNVNKVEGDFVNNGIIYLMAAYEACQKLQDTGMMPAAFKETARDYVGKMIRYHAQINMLGMSGETSMNEYYVIPRLFIAGKKEPVYPDAENLENVFSLEETFIYGPGGSGKSTFLKFVILNSLELKIGAIPIFISLAVFRAKCRLFPSHTLYEQIVQELKEYNFPKNFVDFMLKHAPVLLLLDGFDEGYRDVNEKALLIEHIESYRKLYNGKWSRIIITSRTKDYSFLNPKRQNMELMPFDQQQVDTFLKKRLGSDRSITKFLDYISAYYDITFENRNITDSPEMDRIRERTSLMAQSDLVDERVHDVVIRQRNYPPVLSSPILLSLLVFQYCKSGEIYDSKTALLQNLVKDIIEKNRSTKLLDDVFNWINPNQLEKLLAHLAYQTLKAGEIVMEQSRLYALTENFLQSKSIYVGGGVERLFKPLLNDLGLLTATANNQFKFQHLFIHEYLAATFLNDNNVEEVFENGLLFRSEWAQTMELLLEMRLEDTVFAEKYFAVAAGLLRYSTPIKKLVELAKEKSLDVDGRGCCGVAFYYICMYLFYNVGERGIYASLRIASEVLHRILGTKRKDPTITLLTVSQEMTYVAKKIDHKNLLVDGWLFRLYEKQRKRKDEKVSLDEIAGAFKHAGFHYLLSSLNAVSLAVKKNEESKIIDAVKKLLTERNLTLDHVLSVYDLNVLCKWLDLVDVYIKTVPGFGKNNEDYAHFFESGVEMEPIAFSNTDQDYLTSRDYFELGSSFQKTNDTLADEYISKAIEKNPTNSFYHFNRGAFYWSIGNLKKSLNDFIAAERLNPGYDSDYQFQLSYGVLYKSMEEFEKALQRFKKASKIDAEGIASRWFSAEIFLKTRQFAKCITICLDLAKINPDEGHFVYAAAYCQLRLNKYREAVKSIDEAIKLSYAEPESLFIKAYCQLELGESTDVQNLLEDYLKSKNAPSFLYLPLLHSYKLNNNKKMYDEVVHNTVVKEKILDLNMLQPLPLSISPGHLEIRRFGKTYYKEDFVLPANYSSF